MYSSTFNCRVLFKISPSWLIDHDKDDEGMRVLADLHGGDPEDMVAKAEFQEIKDRVIAERESGEARSYAVMWKRYKRRVLLAMSSQAFAQLVSFPSRKPRSWFLLYLLLEWHKWYATSVALRWLY